MAKKVLGLPLKSNKAKVEANKAAKAAAPEKVGALVLGNCVNCGKKLTKLDFNSREGNLYVHVCDHLECGVYRYIQGHEGTIPTRLRLHKTVKQIQF